MTRGRRSARPVWRSWACRWTSTGSCRTVARGRRAGDARAPVPDRGRCWRPSGGALLAWGGIVLEDDYDSEYRYDRAPVGTLQRLAPDRVVYLGTASKTLAPALRLGWALAPPDLAAGARPRALGGRLGRPGDHGAGLRAADRQRRARPAPAPHPPRVPRRRDRLVAALERHSPAVRSRASPPACTCCCGSRPTRTSRRSSTGSPSAGSASAGSPPTRSPAPAQPALVIGYGRLPIPAIDRPSTALSEALG